MTIEEYAEDRAYIAHEEGVKEGLEKGLATGLDKPFAPLPRPCRSRE